MFHGADENSQHSDDEDGTSTDEPNEQIESQLLSRADLNSPATQGLAPLVRVIVASFGGIHW